MNRRIIAIASAVIVVAVVIAAVIFANRVPTVITTAPGEKILKVGDVAPPFEVSSTAGYFDSSAAHMPILLEVFATWCPHCRRETVTLNKIFSEYSGRVKVIAVDGSEFADEMQTMPESQVNMVNFGQTFRVAYPLAYDRDLTVAKDYYYRGFPSIVVIDKNGRVASITSGEATLPELEKRLNLVL